MTGSGAASISGTYDAAMRPTTAAVILAAGRSARFGSNKLLADFRGRPILQHVMDLAAAAGLGPVVIVAGQALVAPDAPLRWRDEVRVINSRPEAGLSRSLKLGLAALSAKEAHRALVLLGDQPLLSESQLSILMAAPLDEARPIIVPRYLGHQGTPVMLERPAWPLAEELSGDRGMSQLFETRPELVRFADVPGRNPDVDTPADLAALVNGEG